MKPMLVAMKGHPATGKSTLAEFLSKTLKWPLIDKDDARDCLSMLQQQQPGADLHHLPKQLNAISYDITFRIAKTQLRLGLGVVVVCPLAWPWLFRRCHSIAIRNQVKMVLIECVCSDSGIWKQRLENRAAAGLAKSEADVLGEATSSEAEKLVRDAWAGGLGSVFEADAQEWWHKHRKWEEMKKTVENYGEWSNYELGTVQSLVVDTCDPSFSPKFVLDWLQQQQD